MERRRTVGGNLYRSNVESGINQRSSSYVDATNEGITSGVSNLPRAQKQLINQSQYHGSSRHISNTQLGPNEYQSAPTKQTDYRIHGSIKSQGDLSRVTMPDRRSSYNVSNDFQQQHQNYLHSAHENFQTAMPGISVQKSGSNVNIKEPQSDRILMNDQSATQLSSNPNMPHLPTQGADDNRVNITYQNQRQMSEDSLTRIYVPN